jgi:hypothetical protein
VQESRGLGELRPSSMKVQPPMESLGASDWGEDVIARLSFLSIFILFLFSRELVKCIFLISLSFLFRLSSSAHRYDRELIIFVSLARFYIFTVFQLLDLAN